MTELVTEQAKGIFTISKWEEGPYQEWEAGAKLVKAEIEGTFSGDFEGAGSSQLLVAYTEERTSTFAGLQVVDGAFVGRSGRFVLLLQGAFEGGVATVTWTVVPGSATGELTGLRGEGGYVAGPGDYPNISVDLTYSFE